MGSITNQFANRNRMKVDEARAILGVKDSATLKEVNEVRCSRVCGFARRLADLRTCARAQRFERLFNANDVAKGGSFYLQSKIYRAQQTLSEHVVEKARERASAKDKGEDMAEALKPSEAKDK